MVLEWLAPLAETAMARALIVSPTLYLLMNAAHILAIGMLFGSILALDLRLLGLGRALPLAPTANYLSRLSATGLALAIITGLCLFSVRPVEYATNIAFLSKLALVALGAAHALVLHRGIGWRRAITDGSVTTALRVSAFASISIWTGAIVAGRWIGFL
ncbi:MAG: DUF6644 family protein [Pseudorhizobium sp.]